MKNFLKIADNADVTPLNMALALHSDLWNSNDLRTTYPNSPHAAADDIWLRFNPIDPSDPTKVIDAIEAIPYAPMIILPQCRPLIFGLMARVEGERLGRCLITRLAPGKRIVPHCDEGAPATYHERFHIVLESHPGCTFRAGDETVYMKTGEVWWFDNTQEHEVVNNSQHNRTHLIVDIKVSK
jgi:hypothetical protein